MTRSLAVRQAVTIRPRPTVHLLALTGILMVRIRMSPPAGSVPDPLHPCAPPPRAITVSSLSCGSPSRRHSSGGQDTGAGGCVQAAAGLFLGKCGI